MTKTFTTIATTVASAHKIATIKRAYADSTKNVTKLMIAVEGENHDTYLTIPNASTARLQILKTGRRIAYNTTSQTISQDEEGNRYFLDRALIITLLNN